MEANAIFEAAQSLAARTTLQEVVEATNSLQSAGFSVRPATVTHGSARMRFSLTCGVADDELVRLENNLSRFGVICGALESGEKTAVQSPMISTFLPLSQVLEQTSQDSSSLTPRRNDRAKRRNRKSWSAAVARA